MKRIVLILTAVGSLLLLGSWLAYGLGMIPWSGSSAAPFSQLPAPALAGAQQPADAPRVVALGRLVPAGGILTVGALVGGRLEALDVSEGDQVSQGQQLGYLDSRWLRQLELEMSQAHLDEARQRLEAEKEHAAGQVELARIAEQQAKATPVEIAAQEQRLDVLQAHLEAARDDLQRFEGLSQDLISQPELQRQRLRVRQAELEVQAAEAELQRMRQSVEFQIRAAQQERRMAEAAERQVGAAIPLESASKRVELAQQQLERSFLTAPGDGQVLAILTQAGEFVTQGPILQMANLEEMVCVAEVYKTQVRHLQVGQPVRIESRAFDPPYRTEGLRGTVTHIGRLISAPQLRPLDPFSPVDRHVGQVRIELDRADAPQAANFVDMQVEVHFLDS